MSTTLTVFLKCCIKLFILPLNEPLHFVFSLDLNMYGYKDNSKAYFTFFILLFDNIFLSQPGHSGDLMLWVGVCMSSSVVHCPSCVNIFFIRIAEPILTKIWYVAQGR